MWDHAPSPAELLDARLKRGWIPRKTVLREGEVVLGYAACATR